MRPLGPRTPPKYFPPEEMKEDISKVEKEEEDAHATAFADAVGHLTAAANLLQSWNLSNCFKGGSLKNPVCSRKPP